MIKSSSKRPLLQREPTDGESSAGEDYVNGLMRATERDAILSSSRRVSHLLQRRAVLLYGARADGFPSIWVAPQELFTQSCPMITHGTGLFYLMEDR